MGLLVWTLACYICISAVFGILIMAGAFGMKDKVFKRKEK